MDDQAFRVMIRLVLCLIPVSAQLPCYGHIRFITNFFRSRQLYYCKLICSSRSLNVKPLRIFPIAAVIVDCCDPYLDSNCHGGHKSFAAARVVR
jgi:hypothetical protein